MSDSKNVFEFTVTNPKIITFLILAPTMCGKCLRIVFKHTLQ
jgi:hypothetical protein